MENGGLNGGLIEAWGRGTIKILNECRQAKVALPVFKYDLSGFIIEFSYTGKKPVLSTAPELSGTTTDKVIFYIANNNNSTIAELAEKIGVVERTIKRILKQLQDDNKIIRIGSDKVGAWKVV